MHPASPFATSRLMSQGNTESAVSTLHPPTRVQVQRRIAAHATDRGGASRKREYGR